MKRTLNIPFITTSLVVILLVGLVGVLGIQPVGAAPFTGGNIVVYRVGNGTDALSNTGNQVFLDEYTPAGVLVQSIPMPTAPDGNNKPLIASGVAGSEGGLNRSFDNRFLVFAGYNAQLGGTTSLAGSDAAVVNRVIGRVDANGNVDTTTSLNNYSAFDNPREVASDNGNRFWAVGGNGSATDPEGLGGVFFAPLGATTGITITTTNTNTVASNLRSINIFDGQLYASSQQGKNVGRGILKVGTGLPTTPVQPLTLLPGMGTNSKSPNMRDFVMLDLDPGVPGVDTIYSANEYSGLWKYSLVGGIWVKNSVIEPGADSVTPQPMVGDQVYRRITAVNNGNTVTIYATRYQVLAVTLDPLAQENVITDETNGELVKLVDTTGYNGAFTGAPTVIVPASPNKAIRGVALAPVDPNAPTSTPTSTTDPNATATTTATATATMTPTATTGPGTPTATTGPGTPTATTGPGTPTATTGPEGPSDNVIWLPLLTR